MSIARMLRKGRRPVLAVSEWVHDKLTYQRGTTGVRQDYAHLTLAMLRSIGVRPAE